MVGARHYDNRWTPACRILRRPFLFFAGLATFLPMFGVPERAERRTWSRLPVAQQIREGVTAERSSVLRRFERGTPQPMSNKPEPDDTPG